MDSKLNQLILNPELPVFLLWHGQIADGLDRILVEYFKHSYHFLGAENSLMLTNKGDGLTSDLLHPITPTKLLLISQPILDSSTLFCHFHIISEIPRTKFHTRTQSISTPNPEYYLQ